MTAVLFDPDRCDLCGHGDAVTLVSVPTGRSMRSDRGILPCDLRKLHCQRCGLVRSGPVFDEADPEQFYAEQYSLSLQPEHYFYTLDGQAARSEVLCDWLVEGLGEDGWRKARGCLEVGAGAGLLLGEFMRRFPGVNFNGFELSQSAAARARQDGLPVDRVPPARRPPRSCDLVYSVAVIEHVPSPTQFLSEIHRLLTPGGQLVLCQPTQDVPSYDLFFFDHLHHFGSEHMREYARKCGFVEQRSIVGHPLMPNFSLHVWRATEPPAEYHWEGRPVHTTCPASARQVLADMTRLDQHLAELAAQGRRVAVFGLNEVYWLTRAYSSLGAFPVICGLDDTPDRPEYSRLGFPVVVPEASLTLGVQDVFLTMNRIYYEQASQRLARLGVRVHPVLSRAA
jgi:SAM-dependent methyltransferase